VIPRTRYEINAFVGNKELLNLRKTAFLCSRKVPAGVILKCYDWAIVQRDASNCVISGFHSTIEKDVFHYLLKGTQPIMLVLHRGIGSAIQKELAGHLEAGRLLIISPFRPNQKRGDARTAAIRNRLMVDLADEIVIGHASKGGALDKLLLSISKPSTFL